MANDINEAKGSMDKRKRGYASNATIYAVFAIGAIVLVNLIGTRVFGRLDLTQNGIYTLSPASKQLVRESASLEDVFRHLTTQEEDKQGDRT